MHHSLKQTSLSRVLTYALSYVLALLWLFPIVWMAFSAFKPMGSPVSILSVAFAPPFTVENFSIISQKAPVYIWTYNSAYIAIAVTLIVLLITSMAAYSLSKLHFKGKKIMYIVITMGLMIPIEAIIIPLYKTMADLRMLNTYTGLIIPSLTAPLGVLIMKQFFDDLPNELIEAARIDGAGIFRIWYSICMPLSRNSLAAVGIFTFTNSWNNFLWPFLSITSERMMTLPVGIPQFQGANLSEFTLPMTVSLVASIPAIVVFLIFQKQIIQGVAMTGIKG
ncbi:MAG: carbohydrate ABC transporter permease [Spirochaetia bacterium]|jgi:multiple sugar transport system permease protein|nr:carbohydrate ABC transporter permease [Spirochaetia bacterium]